MQNLTSRKLMFVLSLFMMIGLASCGGSSSSTSNESLAASITDPIVSSDFTQKSVTKKLDTGESFTLSNAQELTSIPTQEGSKVYTAKVDDDNEGFFVVDGEMVEGTFTKNGKLYTITSSKNTQAVSEVAIIEDADTPQVPQTEAKTIDVSAYSSKYRAVTKSDVKVLFVYNNDFWTWCDEDQATLNSRIHAMLAYTNNAFVKSQINAIVSMAGTVNMTFAQDKNSNANSVLQEIQSKVSDSNEELYRLREEYKADVVYVLRKQEQRMPWGGVAYLAVQDYDPSDTAILAFSNYAIGAQNILNGLDYSTFAHELGHTFGCHHDAETRDRSNKYDNSYNEYANGYWFHEDNKNLTTIMGYRTSGRDRIQNFSNPSVLHNGVETGIVGEGDEAANCARFINLSAPLVADYQQVEVTPTETPNTNSTNTNSTQAAIRPITL